MIVPMARLKILLAPSSFSESDPEPLQKLLEQGYEVIRNPVGRKLTKDELLNLLPSVHGMIAGLETIDREVLQKSSLKVISRCGSGLSNIDMSAANELGVRIYSVPDGPVEAVAELTLGALLSLLRHLVLMNANLHAGHWTKMTGFQLKGKTVLIIGFGRIGRRVAELLKPFEVRILVVDPNQSSVGNAAQLISLEQGLKEADVVTLHASGEEEILGEDAFQHVKSGAFLLNVARGKLINEQCLLDALESKKIAGAWLDCFAEEPYCGPLTKFPQVILTPHIGSYTRESRKKMELDSARNLITGLTNCV